MKRKIAAILAADIVGYSKLMAEDEEETVRRLAAYRQVFDDFIARHGGRIFNTAGDALLAEFASAVDAVRCAVEVQESLRTRNLAYPQSRQMHFRMGITIGDVVERDGDLLGDGVNIAARLQALASPGGVCVSRSIYEQVANKLSIRFSDIGRQQVKNIPSPVHAYIVALDSSSSRSTGSRSEGSTKSWQGVGRPARAALGAGALLLVAIAVFGIGLLVRRTSEPTTVAIATPTTTTPPSKTEPTRSEPTVDTPAKSSASSASPPPVPSKGAGSLPSNGSPSLEHLRLTPKLPQREEPAKLADAKPVTPPPSTSPGTSTTTPPTAPASTAPPGPGTAPPKTETQPPVTTVGEPPLHDCDRRAGLPSDPDHVGPGVGSITGANAAVAACRAALAQFPGAARFEYQLTRGLLRLGQTTEAVQIVSRLAEKGDRRGLNGLGMSYRTGTGFPADQSRALKLFRESADKGYPPAISNIGIAYSHAWGVDRDDAEAVRLFRKAIALGDAQAMSLLGFMYLNGRGVTKSPEEALNLFRKAAAAGVPDGLANLAWAYNSGAGVARDAKESADWILKALQAGSGWALTQMTQEAARTWTPEFRIALQRRLKDEKIYNGPLNGVFGLEMQAAVRAYFDKYRL